MTKIPVRTKTLYFSQGIDLENDDLRAALYDTSTDFSFDPSSHEFVGDVLDGGTTANEPTDGSYERKSLTGQTINQAGGTTSVAFEADDLEFVGLDTVNDIQGLIVFRQETDDTDSTIVFVLDDAEVEDFPAITGGVNLSIEWSDRGIQILT